MQEHTEMTSQPLQTTPITVSVIIPARNEEQFIADSVDSVMRQDCAGFEVIVVDNGSTDRTAEIAAAHGARVVHEPVPGLPRAREAGRQAARGELLVYLDADTHIPPGYLARLLQVFYNRPEVLACSTPFRFHDGDWLTNATIAIHFSIYKVLHVLRINRFIFGGSFAVRQSVMAHIGGFNTDLEFYGEDTDLSKRIGKQGVIEFYDRIRSSTSARRYHRQGIITTLFLYLVNYLSMLFLNRTCSVPSRFPLPHVSGTAIVLFTLGFLIYGSAYPEAKVFGRVTSGIDTPQRVVALTFDDGPNGRYTQEILHILDEEGVKGTFFLVGRNVEAYPQVTREIVKRGHAIGNHSHNHTWSFPFTAKSQVIREVKQADAAIYRVTGHHTTLFRPPHGLRTPWMIEAAHEAGYQVVTWDGLTSDYRRSDEAADIAGLIVTHVRPGSIIVLHDGNHVQHGANRHSSVAALRIIIRELKAQGYRFTTL